MQDKLKTEIPTDFTKWKGHSIIIEGILALFTYDAYPCLAGPLLCCSNPPSGFVHLSQFPLPRECNLIATLQKGSKCTRQRQPWENRETSNKEGSLES